MKVKLRLGDEKYWYQTEDWQFKANRNLNGLIFMCIAGVWFAIENGNIKGAITFGIVATMWVLPQKIMYLKWQKQYWRKKVGVEEKQVEGEDIETTK